MRIVRTLVGLMKGERVSVKSMLGICLDPKGLVQGRCAPSSSLVGRTCGDGQ